MDPETTLQHLGEEEHILGAVTPPIFQNTLFAFPTVADWHAAYDPTNAANTGYGYSRLCNPTLHVAEQKIAAIENVESARLVGSGMAAMSSAILHSVRTGDHVVCVDTVYGPTRRFLLDFMARYGVTVTFADASNTDAILAAVQPNTKLMFLETPSSLVMQIQDLAAIGEFCRARGIITAIDTTFNAGVLMRPGDFGIDLMLHTASKYYGGHSDVIGGAICGSKERIDSILTNEIELLGNIMAPMIGWLVIRGLRTLVPRLRHSAASAMQIADYLATHDAVQQVLMVGHPTHPQADLIEKLGMKPGGLLSFIPRTQDLARIHEFINKLRIFQIGVSWGGFESLGIPITVNPVAWGKETHIVRLYCGMESANDLQDALREALPILG